MSLFQEISRGWKPGAISKRLLSILNKAKSHQYNVQMSKPVKKAKKRVEEKPTLIVCKRNGEYIIEMQVEPGKDEVNVDNCSPLIYKIAPEDNEDRIKGKERKQRRLIRKAVKEVWSDHYDPDICQKNACFKAYQHAIGLLPYDPNNSVCNCPEEKDADDDLNSCSWDDIDVSSECSSLDVDWEIHFSPPIVYYNNDN